MNKKCIGECNRELPETEEYFLFRKDTKKFKNICIECSKERDKKRYENNKDKIKQKNKEYYSNNRDERLQQMKEYDKTHKRDRKEYRKQWSENKTHIQVLEKVCSQCQTLKKIEEFSLKKDNKDGHRKLCRECENNKYKKYYNKEEVKINKLNKNLIWRENNVEYMRNYQRKWQKEKRDNDPGYKLRQNVGRAIRTMLNGAKNSSVITLLPYSIEELKQHLENKFSTEMTWENYGKVWEIDHIYPQSLLPYETTEEENFIKCWSLTNLQPLLLEDNRKKYNKLI